MQRIVLFNIRWCHCSVVLCLLPLYAAEGTKWCLAFKVQENCIFFLHYPDCCHKSTSHISVADYYFFCVPLSHSSHFVFIKFREMAHPRAVCQQFYVLKKKSNVMSTHFLSGSAVIAVIMIPHKFPGTIMVKLGKT